MTIIIVQIESFNKTEKNINNAATKDNHRNILHATKRNKNCWITIINKEDHGCIPSSNPNKIIGNKQMAYILINPYNTFGMLIWKMENVFLLIIEQSIFIEKRKNTIEKNNTKKITCLSKNIFDRNNPIKENKKINVLNNKENFSLFRFIK